MLVGKDISSCSYPQSIKMKKGNSNGTLILGIKRGEEIHIEYSKKKIMDKINSYFGYKLINEIKLQTFGSEINKKKQKKISGKFSINLHNKISEIKSKSIQNSLSQLLKIVKND